MTLPMSARARIADSAPHPRSEGHEPEAARRAEGVLRPTSSASLAHFPRSLLEVAVLAGVLINVLIWSAVLSGRW